MARWNRRSMAVAAGVLAAAAHAQQPFATLSTTDARVSGLMEVSDHTVRLLTNANIVAFDHTARIDLTRGGDIGLCSTSEFHLYRSGTADGLQFALDRGAMELRTVARPQDIILTPDLRFTLLTAGTLDLQMRVARDGDTCVENRGETAPVLQVAETFGSNIYHLAPRQHVLFVHGNLRAVVDRETSSCGCPPPTTLVASKAAPGTPQRAAADHPFPEADSAGLTNNGDGLVGKSAPSDPALAFGATPDGQPVTAPPPPPEEPPVKDLFHIIGRFFKRLFRQHPK